MAADVTYYAVIALVAVDPSHSHEKVYDLVDAAFKDSDELIVQYRDIDPNWRSYQVLDDNAEFEDDGTTP